MTLDSLPDLDTSGLCLVKTLSTALTCWPYRNTRHGSLRSDGDAGGRPPLSAAPRRGRLLNGPPRRRPSVQDLTDPRLHREHAPWRVPWKESQDTTRLYADIAFPADRKSTRLNSSHRTISYAVFCLKKKNQNNTYHS